MLLGPIDNCNEAADLTLASSFTRLKFHCKSWFKTLDNYAILRNNQVNVH